MVHDDTQVDEAEQTKGKKRKKKTSMGACRILYTKMNIYCCL